MALLSDHVITSMANC